MAGTTPPMAERLGAPTANPSPTPPSARRASLARIDALLRAADLPHTYRVLEAGGGAVTRFRLPGEPHITTLDISERQLAKNQYAHEKVRADLESHEFPASSFDLIICNNVLEHLRRPDKALASLCRWTRPEGRLLIGAPNRRSMAGLVTRLTPHRFHVFALRHILRDRNVSELGGYPFRTFLKPDMDFDRVRARLAAADFEVLHSARYESDRRERLAHRNPAAGAAYDACMTMGRAVSLGRWRPELSDYHIVARRRPLASEKKVHRTQ
ncbi:MAG: class I SAM-dependent methyltransferase [Pseudomonadota bacterium]